jgi:hypothetical protein
VTEARETRCIRARTAQEAALAASLLELEVLLLLAVEGSDFEDESAESLLDEPSLSAVADCLPRLSVAYQPEPLKTMRGALSSRRATPLPHSSQVCSMGAEKLSRSS